MRFAPLLAIAAALATGTMVYAQMPTTPPGVSDPARVMAGTYTVESSHTQVLFGVDHLGFNAYYGHFSDVTGTLTLDPAKPAAATIDVTIPIASVRTTSTKLDEELLGAKFFDAAKFPTMRFKSTKIEVQGGSARILGDLTLHGVTRPVALEALLHGAGKSMMGKGAAIGFDGRTKIRRSDFGVTYGVPMVSDEVTVIITIAFEQQV